MIGIQGETALEEVTKSPADAALSTTSTNSVQNKVITKKINEINNDLRKGSITVVTDGVKTWRQILGAIWEQTNISKVGVNTRLNNNGNVYYISHFDSASILLSRVSTGTTGGKYVSSIYITYRNSTRIDSGADGNDQDLTQTVPSAGSNITLYY